MQNKWLMSTSLHPVSRGREAIFPNFTNVTLIGTDRHTSWKRRLLCLLSPVRVPSRSRVRGVVVGLPSTDGAPFSSFGFRI